MDIDTVKFENKEFQMQEVGWAMESTWPKYFDHANAVMVGQTSLFSFSCLPVIVFLPHFLVFISVCV